MGGYGREIAHIGVGYIFIKNTDSTQGNQLVRRNASGRVGNVFVQISRFWSKYIFYFGTVAIQTFRRTRIMPYLYLTINDYGFI